MSARDGYEDLPGSQLVDLRARLARHARLRPQRLALACDGEALAWGELERRVVRVAAALVGMGVGQQDRVGILAEPSLAYVEALLGAIVAGACAVPLPALFQPGAVAKAVADADLAVLVASGRLRGVLEVGGERAAIRAAPLRIALDFEDPEWRSYERLLAAGNHAPLVVEPEPGAAFDIIYSSGTTRAPTGIVHSHRMRSAQIRRMAQLELGPEATALLATPLYSNTTLVALLPALAEGATVILMSKFDPAGYLALAARHRVSHTMLVPVQYQRLLASEAFAAADLSAFRVKWCTSAPLSVELKRALIRRWPGRLVEIYGQTEGGATTLLDASAHPDKLHTVGQPAAGVELRIVGEQGEPLPPGQVGEIVGRAASMMSGYHRQPDLTEALSWRDGQGRVFYRTGDLGMLDADGYLVLRGRSKDVIISGGHNIHAADLEQVLGSHPAVAEVAVIGIPSHRWGESPLALVVARADRPITPRHCSSGPTSGSARCNGWPAWSCAASCRVAPSAR